MYVVDLKSTGSITSRYQGGQDDPEKSHFIIVAVFVCIIFAITLQPFTNAAAFNLKSGAVYVLTNQQVMPSLHLIARPMATNFPIDMALNNGSRYLYLIAAGLQTVEAFRVEPDGSLTPIGSVGGLPFGSQGIAAR